MRLADLSAELVKLTTADGSGWRIVETLAEAQGVMFQCPKCAIGKIVEEEDGRRFVRGAHSIICWFRGRGVSDEVEPGPGRWTPSGSGLHDLTFVPGDPPMACSVLLLSGCEWHGFVRDGEAA